MTKIGFAKLSKEERIALARKGGQVKHPRKGFGSNRKLAVLAGQKSKPNRNVP